MLYPPTGTARTTRELPSDELAQRAANAEQLLRRLANRQRLMILCLLSGRELCVSALNQEVALSQSALSQHLAQLRRSGMVATRREAQTIYYRLRDERVLTLLTALCELGGPQAPGDGGTV